MKKILIGIIFSVAATSTLSASSVQIYNQGIPNRDVQNKSVRLYFEASGTKSIFNLPSQGGHTGVKVDSKSYKRVYLSVPDDEIGDVTCQNVPSSFSKSKTYTVDVGYRNNKWTQPYCRFR
jgi:hypothetical protein